MNTGTFSMPVSVAPGASALQRIYSPPERSCPADALRGPGDDSAPSLESPGARDCHAICLSWSTQYGARSSRRKILPEGLRGIS